MHLFQTSRLGWIALAFVGFLPVIGCSHHALPTSQAQPMIPQGSASLTHNDNAAPAPAANPPGNGDDTQTTAKLVAQKVRDFANSVALTTGASHGQFDPNSAAGALDPDALRLSPAPSGAEGSHSPPPPANNSNAAAPASATLTANKSQRIIPAEPAGVPGDAVNAADFARANSVPDLRDSATGVALDPLAAKLQRRIHDDPQDVAAALNWQLYQFVHDEPVPQFPALAPLNAEDRELLSAVLDALSNFNNAVRADPNLLLSHKVRPFLELADRLRNQAELVIPTIELCTKVSGFGVYDPIKPARFAAGKETKVILYCEVENFASQVNADKQYETRLSQDVVLYTEQNGLEVWRDKTANKEVVDLSRNRRHDFFLAKVITLPPNLTIGRYLLKVSVVDNQVKRVAENTIPIEIVAE